MSTRPTPLAATSADLLGELEEQTAALVELVRTSDRSHLTARPSDGKWAAIEHVDHLVKVNRRYADALEAALEKGRARGRTGAAPFRGSMIGRMFARAMEPPVSVRVKTPAALNPDADLDVESTSSEFVAVQGRLGDLIRGADGLDMDRIRTTSPFLRFVRVPVFSWFCVVTAHTRRHVWLMREALAQIEGSGPGA